MLQSKVNIRHHPYLIINLIFAGVILLIMAYSGIFSPETDNYPVSCIHEKLTGEQCISCGLSHGFSLILRGKISEAYQWNLYSMRVFLFFAIQFIMRITFSVLYAKYPGISKQLITMDSLGSGLMFLIVFLPFIRSIFYFL